VKQTPAWQSQRVGFSAMTDYPEKVDTDLASQLKTRKPPDDWIQLWKQAQRH